MRTTNHFYSQKHSRLWPGVALVSELRHSASSDRIAYGSTLENRS